MLSKEGEEDPVDDSKLPVEDDDEDDDEDDGSSSCHCSEKSGMHLVVVWHHAHNESVWHDCGDT